jgi:glycosyltransferase involved in cell wall biosynthesis
MFSERWEKRILEHASVITTVSKTMKNDLLSKFGSRLSSKIKVMYNGWDEEDFNDVPVRKKTKKIIIRYIGNFYGHQTPKYFIEALEKLKRKNKLPEDIQIEFIGNYQSEIKDIFDNSSIASCINIVPQVNHKRAVDSLMTCDGLLLFVATYKGKGVLTGKLFEYLRSGKEILAMIPPNGEAAEILKKYNYRFITLMENIKNIEEQFVEFYGTIKKRKDIIFKISAEYNRENQTGNFVSFVEGRL